MTEKSLRKLHEREKVNNKQRRLILQQKERLTFREAIKEHGHVSRESGSRLVPLFRILGVLYWGS